MTYIKQSVLRPQGNPAQGSPGAGLRNRDLLTLIDIEDIAYMPPRDDKGVVIVENIVMKPGRYGYDIYMTPGSTELASPSEGEIDQEGFKPSVKFRHPGNEQEVREFKVNSINRKFIVILRYCSGRPADLIGSICNPCKLTASYTANNESNANEFTFEQVSKGEDIAIYRGTVPMEEPVGTIEAAATSVAYTADGQYMTTSGSAAIANITGGQDGALVTILGTSGTAPTVTGGDSSNIMLKGGRSFTASEGSQITLRAFDAGANKIVWVEQSRYVAA